MPRVLQTWDAETHEAILLALLEHMKPSRNDISAVAKLLHGKGFTFSEGALTSAVTRSLLIPILFYWLPSLRPTPQQPQMPLGPRHLWPVANGSDKMSLFKRFPIPPAKTPTVWDADAHLALLMAVVEVAPPSASEWEEILKIVAQKGYVYTASAALTIITMSETARMNWTHTADHDLLTSIVAVTSPSQDELRQVMVKMHELGYTCTVKAISQHLQKLRRKEANAPGDNDAAGSGPSTPAPKRAKSGPKGKGGTGKRTKTQQQNDDSEDDSEDQKPAAAKRRRTAPVKKEPKSAVKVEVKDESDDDGHNGQIKEEADYSSEVEYKHAV
ncbi:hypothetical protein QBC35DRAFT_471888 [Podospora australis]|uniref:Uncharacterized protein n=1 Tax=Podospora australis TaxID=1536484 RepID=A0AAN6X2F7_9PEZI|nr:hypothetical protein QBC35DRAFT_471888 [Podospora australis]